ncbi:MAG: hypothetical protein IJ192_05360 [Clostridia bacterium]|nr:hypothetical protein [Clostridia bacterium]
MEENNGNIRFLSAVSYIGVLFVIGHFAVEKDNPDLRFHTFQGGVLFAFFVAMYFMDFLLYLALSFAPALQLILTLLLSVGISMAYILLMGMGIYYGAKCQQKLLPYVGKVSVLLRTKLDERNDAG